ncbi:hypothetical protein, partial [Burkholderia stabilis]
VSSARARPPGARRAGRSTPQPRRAEPRATFRIILHTYYANRKESLLKAWFDVPLLPLRKQSIVKISVYPAPSGD